MPDDRDALRIAPVTAPRAAEAFELVLRDLAEDDRREQVRTFLSGGVPCDGLLAAWRGERLVGAIFSQIQPGKIAMLWPPRLAPASRTRPRTGFWRRPIGGWRRRAFRWSRCCSRRSARRTTRCCSRRATVRWRSLLYLVCGESEFPPQRPAPSWPRRPLEFEPYTEANHDRLARLIEATYEGTLDCPRLNDVRRTDDILEGYRQTGAFDPERWLIVRHQGQDVGCLIVTDHPEHGSCELVYMGVAAAWRGHGWGKEIARFAQWLTARAGRPRLVLAVDAANAPAIDMYESVGFHAWDRRTVYAKVFGSRS